MRAVILQPMYLPWSGYLGLIDQADVFVYYDDVQFTRRSWQRRNRIKVPDGDETWLTVPVEKDFGQEIRDVSINQTGWTDEHWSSIHHSYARAPFFDEFSDGLAEFYEREWTSLLDLNTQLIDWLVDAFGIDRPRFEFASDLDATGEKTDRLIDILTTLEVDEYVSGPAAKDYIDTDAFDHNDIRLFWHEFDHPEYEQLHGEFVSHLSSIDLLFHCGRGGTELIRESEQDALVLD